MKRAILSLLLFTLAAFTTPSLTKASAQKFGPDITAIDYVPNSGYPVEFHATLSGTTTVETQYYVHIVYYTNSIHTTTYALDYCFFDVNAGYSDGWYRNGGSVPTCYGVASWYVQFVYP